MRRPHPVSTCCAQELPCPLGIPNEPRSSEVQRRNLLCNGAIVFDDSGELLPDGSVVAPHRVFVEQLAVAA
ncbi:DUF5999 family protein [Streptomyces sp. NBC_00996]|uniref:DUF5999 family protein n=1 Tax=Streptomyces sp. NBC_00996 TaxID=2903710 RepID=UPI003864AAA1